MGIENLQVATEITNKYVKFTFRRKILVSIFHLVLDIICPCYFDDK